MSTPISYHPASAPAPLWSPAAINRVANQLYGLEDDYPEALAEAFREPLGWDPNVAIRINRPQDDFYRGCDNWLPLLLLKQPKGYETYVHRLLDAGFSFEGRNHYELTKKFAFQHDTSLLHHAIEKGLNIHAVCSEEQPHNVLVDLVSTQRFKQYHTLLELGLDPFTQHRFVEMAGHVVERSLFAEALQFCRGGVWGDPETYINIPLDLLKKGVARLDSIEGDFIWFTDVYGDRNYVFPSVPRWMKEESENQATHRECWEVKRHAAFKAHLEMAQQVTVDYLSGILPPDEMTEQELINVYTINQLDAVCTQLDWRGHEQHLFALYSQMPTHIQQQMMHANVGVLLAGAEAVQPSALASEAQSLGTVLSHQESHQR